MPRLGPQLPPNVVLTMAEPEHDAHQGDPDGHQFIAVAAPAAYCLLCDQHSYGQRTSSMTTKRVAPTDTNRISSSLHGSIRT